MEEHVAKPIVNTTQPIKQVVPPIQDVPQEKKQESQEEPKKEFVEKKVLPEEKRSRWDVNLSPDDRDYNADPLFYKLADYFGLNPRETDFNKNKLIEIMNWGRTESLTGDDGDILSKIKDLEGEMNILPGMAESRHVLLFRYIVLSKQKQKIEKEMKVWGNYGNR